MNAQSRTIEEAFMKYGIPYQIYGGLRFYDRKEIKDIIAYLRVLDNPSDDVSVQRIINVPKRGIGNVTLGVLQEAATTCGRSIIEIINDLDNSQILTNRTAGKVKKFGKLISSLIDEKEKRSLTDFINTLLEMTDYQTALIEDNSIESQNRLDNIAEFVSAAKEFEDNNPEAGLTEFLENIALVSDIDQMVEDGDNGKGTSSVSLMTLHSAKGLEFPIVFLIGLEEGLFPHARSVNSEEELEEERRLCYVGITRTKKKLYMTHTTLRTLFGTPNLNTPSRFLDEIPEGLIEYVSFPPNEYSYRRSSYINASNTAADYSDDISNSWTSKSGDLKLYQAVCRKKGRWCQNRVGWESIKKSSARAMKKKLVRFQLGDKVHHSKFGNGTVVTTEGEGSNLIIQVAFEQGGIRRFTAELAPLKNCSLPERSLKNIIWIKNLVKAIASTQMRIFYK